ncbi:helix-turn-helix transcriptional regulator [uncultured Draconibacterium sp.]|uniref:helix-turn-helix domain-containing protein n=1 Tax=uncultured Draconibacterium sp. TaxID=1573823 RepID=UPI0029C69D69|nr:helix-turn-helix transcriptional regulator [uncultured Draconibacterium sp.]
MLRIKDLLKEKGISGKEMASRLDITENAFSLIINGKRQPRFELLQLIAEKLDVDIRELFIPTKEEKQDFDFKCPNCGTKLTVTKK